MKKIIVLLMYLGFMVAFQTTYAQLSKAEEKEWKKRIKALEPEQYKNILDESKRLQAELSNVKKDLSNASDELDEKDDKISRLEGQMKTMRTEMESANERARKAASGNEDGMYSESGVVFRVQIGAFFKKEELAKFSEGNKNFNAETDNSVQKFTLGVFKDYWQADTFKKYLRQMGVKDAWIVAFKDGQRVPLKEVLSGII